MAPAAGRPANVALPFSVGQDERVTNLPDIRLVNLLDDLARCFDMAEDSTDRAARVPLSWLG